jgi:hypothetical protein
MFKFYKSRDYNVLNTFLRAIKALSLDDLNKLYKEKLKNVQLSEDGNADLGLYEIARLTKNMFSFNFEETPEKAIFFTIKLKAI